MGCADCQSALVGPHHGYTAGCGGCAARAVSRGPNYRRCLAAKAQDRKYRAELEAMNVTHEQVREAAQRDALGKVEA
jgi:hypothetical protein